MRRPVNDSSHWSASTRRKVLRGLGAVALLFSGHWAAAADSPVPLRLAKIDGIPQVTRVPELLVTEAYRRLNIPIVINGLPNARALKEVDGGWFDGDICRFEQVEKVAPNIVRVPTVVTRVAYVPYVLKGQTANVASVKSIRASQLRVGYRLGAVLFDVHFEGMKMERPTSYASLFQMLLLNRIDIAVAPAGELERIASTLPDNMRARVSEIVVPPPFVTQPMYHYLHTKNAALVPQIEASFKAMKADGTFQRLSQE